MVDEAEFGCGWECVFEAGSLLLGGFVLGESGLEVAKDFGEGMGAGCSVLFYLVLTELWNGLGMCGGRTYVMRL